MQKFTRYFLNAGAKLIFDTIKNKLPRLIDQDIFETANGSSLLQNSDVKKYSDMIHCNKISIDYNNKHVTLGPRKTEYLIQLSQGKTHQNIAINLNLSGSEVALYIANIKQKTGCSKFM